MRYRARPIDFFIYTGVMNAADYYGLDELRKACAGFVQCCITVDTVCALLASAERYIQYKCTKSLVQKVKNIFKQSYLTVIIYIFRICIYLSPKNFT